MECAICGGPNVQERSEVEKSVVDGMAISYVIPVMSCGDCGEMYTDYRAEDIRDKIGGVRE